MTLSELMCLMTGGMATIAGSVLGAYVAFLGGGDPQQQAQFATYLLTASIMNAPAAIVMSKIFYLNLIGIKLTPALRSAVKPWGPILLMH